MSEDEEQGSGCDTVEGSPASAALTSPRGNNTYRYLDNSNQNNLPSLPAMVAAPPPSPALQSRSVRSVRTMVVPPMTLQNNNSQGTEDYAQRAGQLRPLSSFPRMDGCHADYPTMMSLA